MQRLTRVLTWVWMQVLITTALLAQAPSGDLHIKITNIDEPIGMIQIGLYNDPDDFPTEGREYKVIYLPVDGDEVAHTVRGLPAGEYAVAFYHDTNHDSICNLNFLGIPKEGYGFSRNYQPKLRAPHFDETSITVIDSTYAEMVPIY